MNRAPGNDRQETPQEIISGSGHNLHAEVIKELESAEYSVEISPYYVDAHTDKPREVDLVARKTSRLLVGASDSMQLVLAIDCKFLQRNTVFWTFANEKVENSLKVVRSDPEEFVSIYKPNSFLYFRAEKTARLFQTGTANKRSGDDATVDPIYKACAQAIHGCLFAREHTSEPAIIYPIVVVDGPGKFYDAGAPQKELENVLVHIDYSYYSGRDSATKSREQFYVLLLRKEFLRTALANISKEAELLKEYEGNKLWQRLQRH